jgi:hypothetical protein
VHRRTLIFGPLALYASVCRAAAWALITKEEFEREESLAALMSARQAYWPITLMFRQGIIE